MESEVTESAARKLRVAGGEAALSRGRRGGGGVRSQCDCMGRRGYPEEAGEGTLSQREETCLVRAPCLQRPPWAGRAAALSRGLPQSHPFLPGPQSSVWTLSAWIPAVTLGLWSPGSAPSSGPWFSCPYQILVVSSETSSLVCHR